MQSRPASHHMSPSVRYASASVDDEIDRLLMVPKNPYQPLVANLELGEAPDQEKRAVWAGLWRGCGTRDVRRRETGARNPREDVLYFSTSVWIDTTPCPGRFEDAAGSLRPRIGDA